MLGYWHRRWAYAVLAFLFATGLGHYVLHGWCSVRGDFGPAPNPLKPLVLRLHGAAAMLGLVVLGSVIPTHINRFWRLGRNRGPGGIFLICTLLLVVSGYGLYYFGGDESRRISRLLHIAIGFLALPAFFVHLLRGRRRHL